MPSRSTSPMKTEQTHKRGWRSAIPFCHAVLGVYIPWICLISIVRRRSRRCCLCPFCPVPRRLPFGKFPLPFLTLVKGEDIRQQNSGDVLDLMLRDAAVVGELFPPAQVAPPKKYFAAAFSRAAEEWRLERLLSSALFPFASFLSYLKMKTQPPVKPFSPSASAWCPVSEIVLLL